MMGYRSVLCLFSGYSFNVPSLVYIRVGHRARGLVMHLSLFFSSFNQLEDSNGQIVDSVYSTARLRLAMSDVSDNPADHPPLFPVCHAEPSE